MVAFIPLAQPPGASRCTLPGSLPCYPLPLPDAGTLRAAWGGGLFRQRSYVALLFSALRCRTCKKVAGRHTPACPCRPWRS